MNCTYCSSPATITCRNHRRLLCGGENCYALHRLSVRPEPCACFAYQPLRGWKHHLLATAVALAVGTLLMWAVAL